MLKAGMLLLTTCVFVTPVLAQESTKTTENSEAVIAQLKATLEKAEAALQAGRAAEVRAREEAVVQRQRAEEALKAAEVERAKALQARDEAVKQQQVAEQQRLQAIKAEEAAKAAALKEAAAKNPAEKAKADESNAKQPKAERGKKRKAKFTELEQQVAALKKQVDQMQSELNTLKAKFQNDPMKPGLGGKAEAFKNDGDFNPKSKKPLTKGDFKHEQDAPKKAPQK
jgi:hypothetical protein